MQTKLIIGGTLATRASDQSLLKLLARATVWPEQPASGKAGSVAKIAKPQGLTSSYVSRCIRSAFLAPKFVARVLDGTQPPELTADRLVNADDLPFGWDDLNRYVSIRDRVDYRLHA